MSNQVKSIKEVKDLKNKTVLVRCDFDVPLAYKSDTNKNTNQHEYTVVDDSRLKAAMPTILYLLKKKARVVLMGHAGRPGGQVKPELSLEPVAKHLEKILREDLRFKNFDLRINFINQLTDYGLRITDYKIMMLENLRFWLGEEKNDKNFAIKLAELGDIYVNDAFAVSHRSAASVDAIKKYLPSYAGLNLAKEVEKMNEVLERPKRPLVAIIGGAKIETKLPVIDKFLAKADYLLVGGAIANNFFKILGYETGQSLLDRDYLPAAKKLWKKANKGILNFETTQGAVNPSTSSGQVKDLSLKEIKKLQHKIIIPVDVVTENTKTRKHETKSVGQVSLDEKILDIGPKTIELYTRIIKGAKTVVWNGPMGKFEEEEFAKGTYAIAEAILNGKNKAVIGGGETGEAVKQLTVNSQQQTVRKGVFISTGGGAMLEYLGGNKLPGLEGLIQ